MKTQTLLVFLIAFFSFTFSSQASFPVKRATVNNVTVEQTLEEEVKAPSKVAVSAPATVPPHKPKPQPAADASTAGPIE